MRLEEWLDSAAGRLVPEDRTRVEAEVRGHIAQMLEDGSTEDEAIAQLGCPLRARKRFERRFTTETQADRVRDMVFPNFIARFAPIIFVFFGYKSLIAPLKIDAPISVVVGTWMIYLITLAFVLSGNFWLKWIAVRSGVRGLRIGLNAMFLAGFALGWIYLVPQPFSALTIGKLRSVDLYFAGLSCAWILLNFHIPLWKINDDTLTRILRQGRDDEANEKYTSD